MKYQQLNHWLRIPMDEIVKDTPNDMELGEKVRQIYNNKDNNNKKDNMEKISLFDYLGHKAGPELGLKVATAAGKAGVIKEVRQVSNPAWKGSVNLYPKAFLDLYFRNGLTEGTTGKQLLKG